MQTPGSRSCNQVDPTFATGWLQFRAIIHKGQKDRQALLSPTMLECLRQYWREDRLKLKTKSDWLFIPTKNSIGKTDKQLSHTAIGYMIDIATKAAGIKKKLLRIPSDILLPSTF